MFEISWFCPMTDLQTLVDGTIKVCVEEDGFRHCGFVSSHHLVDVKAEQLRHLIRGTASAALLGDVATT